MSATDTTDALTRGGDVVCLPRRMTPAEVAEWLNVTSAWVYEHATELGAKRLGTGPKARLRFDLADVENYLNACSACRGSDKPEPSEKPAIRRRARRGVGTNVVLLPIRGASGAQEAA
jgi:hypothetical protein